MRFGSLEYLKIVRIYKIDRKGVHKMARKRGQESDVQIIPLLKILPDLLALKLLIILLEISRPRLSKRI